MLIHFIRYKQNTSASIEINETTIQPAIEAKYLGVILDNKLKYKALKITIKWVPGHQNIAGNEKADAEAKRAAREKGKLGPNPKYAS